MDPHPTVPPSLQESSLMSTLALKPFRREPAISKFVWNFSVIQALSTPLVRSSSEFYLTFNLLMGRSHGFRVYDIQLQDALSDSVSSTVCLFNVNSHHIVTRRFILLKHAPHPLTGSNFRHTVSGSLPPSFSPSLTVRPTIWSLESI